jgi:hypothetical protein
MPICKHCGVDLQPNGDGWAHVNGLVSCRLRATKAEPYASKTESYCERKIETPCQGGCGKVRSVIYSNSPKDWLCYECSTRQREPRRCQHEYVAERNYSGRGTDVECAKCGQLWTRVTEGGQQ